MAQSLSFVLKLGRGSGPSASDFRESRPKSAASLAHSMSVVIDSDDSDDHSRSQLTPIQKFRKVAKKTIARPELILPMFMWPGSGAGAAARLSAQSTHSRTKSNIGETDDWELEQNPMPEDEDEATLLDRIQKTGLSTKVWLLGPGLFTLLVGGSPAPGG